MAWWNPATWGRTDLPTAPGAAERKASAAGPIIASWYVGQPVWTDRDFLELAREAYILNAVGHRCTRLIASNAATAPWVLYGPDGSEIEEHPLLDLLANPNPQIGGGAMFMEAVYSYTVLAGNAYIEAVGIRRDGGQALPAELWALRPDRMKVIPRADGMVGAYTYTVDGRERRWDVPPRGLSPILHIRDFHPANDWYGLGRVEAAAYAIDRHNAASAHNKALLDNGARPSGALVFEPVDGPSNQGAVSAPEEVLRQAETRLKERHTGPENAGRPMVFGGKVKWEEMGLSPKDMDFGASKDDAARDVCTAFGVPHVLVVSGESTYNNRASAKLELWEETVLPLVDRVTDALNEWLVPRFGDGIRLGIDMDGISALEPRRESKRTSTIALLDKGVIDADEARAALGYGKRDESTLLKIDAAVLKALVDAVPTAGHEPLLRYMQSVGLYSPAMTVEEMIDRATAHLDSEAADQAAAMTPPPPQPGADTDQIDNGGTDAA